MYIVFIIYSNICCYILTFTKHCSDSLMLGNTYIKPNLYVNKQIYIHTHIYIYIYIYICILIH